MKTKIEVLGYEIEIEEVDGVVTVKADFDGETVEEFTLESQEGQGQEDGDDDDVKGFEDFEGQDEEEDFEGQGQEEDEDDSEDDKTLESFQAFINKKK
jgi:hypothetical protein